MHFYAIDIEIDDSSESSSGENSDNGESSESENSDDGESSESENSDNGAGESSDSDLFFPTWYVTRRNRTYHVEKQFYVVRACEKNYKRKKRPKKKSLNLDHQKCQE